MKFTLNDNAEKAAFKKELINSCASGNIEKKTLKKLYARQHCSFKSLIESGSSALCADRFWKAAAAVIFIAAGIYIAGSTINSAKALNEANNTSSVAIGALEESNEALKNAKEDAEEKVSELESELAEAEEKNKELQDTVDTQQQTINDITESSDSEISDLEDTINDLIEQFGIKTASRSGSSTYTDIETIETAKNIIVSYLGVNEQTQTYIDELTEQEEQLQDEADRYPDYQPCYGDMYLTQRFGYNTSTSSGTVKTTYHNGIDVAIGTGGAIYACGKGMVEEVQATDNGGLGIYVKITHGNGYETLYAHLASACVTVGQTVEKGQKIGMMGKTGVATGIHLHLEYFYWGNRVNPLDFVFTWWK